MLESYLRRSKCTATSYPNDDKAVESLALDMAGRAFSQGSGLSSIHISRSSGSVLGRALCLNLARPWESSDLTAKEDSRKSEGGEHLERKVRFTLSKELESIERESGYERLVLLLIFAKRV